MGRINSLCGWKINFYAVWIHFLFWERHSRASGGVRIVRWAQHRAAHWAPKHLFADVFNFRSEVTQGFDAKKANADMPPLLSTYLLMGGWVSDHAVIDRDLNTMHFFTAIDIKAIPQELKRLLRALVG